MENASVLSSFHNFELPTQCMTIGMNKCVKPGRRVKESSADSSLFIFLRISQYENLHTDSNFDI